jgi:hypothetical protein
MIVRRDDTMRKSTMPAQIIATQPTIEKPGEAVAKRSTTLRLPG